MVLVETGISTGQLHATINVSLGYIFLDVSRRIHSKLVYYMGVCVTALHKYALLPSDFSSEEIAELSFFGYAKNLAQLRRPSDVSPIPLALGLGAAAAKWSCWTALCSQSGRRLQKSSPLLFKVIATDLAAVSPTGVLPIFRMTWPFLTPPGATC